MPKYPVPSIVPALLAQTDVNWELLVVHDGPVPESWEHWKEFFSDPRIRWRQTRDRGDVWGHDIREMVLTTDELHGRYVHLTNADNTLVPTAVATMNCQTSEVVAWPVLHNYLGYQVLSPRLMLGGIDLCSVCVETSLAKSVGFPWRDNAADFRWIQEIARRTSDWVFLDSVLSVHN